MNNPWLHRLLAAARADDLARAAADRRRVREARRVPVTIPADSAVTLRYAFPDDEPALLRLAALDSTDPPRGPVLLAEAAGELRVALSLVDGRMVADPFHHCDWLRALLQARAAQLRAEPGTGKRRGRRTSERLAGVPSGAPATLKGPSFHAQVRARRRL